MWKPILAWGNYARDDKMAVDGNGMQWWRDVAGAFVAAAIVAADNDTD